MSESVWTYLALIVTAFLAGGMNSIAGGGTLLTFPTLLSVVSPAVANATSTVALLPGSVAGALGFRSEIAASRKFILRMFVPSLIGGGIGSWLVIEFPDAFATLVPWLILTAALLFLVQQPISKWMRKHKPDHEPGSLGIAVLLGCQFLVAVYGGYFGAGIGILMLTTLGFMGVGDIHRMNGVKTLLASLINTASVGVFVAGGLVNWEYAAVMAGSAIAGGYIGARVSRRLPASVVRWAVIAIGFGLSAIYFARQYGS